MPFNTVKASANYQFEYLYIDALGIANPGNVEPVVVNQNINGFVVDFAGIPLAEGYILRWRVVVNDVTINPIVGAPKICVCNSTRPEHLRRPLSILATGPVYGFSELRVENLIDPVATQRVINVQVAAKTTLDFTVGLNPPPDSNNYYLVARTP